MIIPDSSVWVEMFRREDAALEGVLLGKQAELHPFVLGELACGNLGSRKRTLSMLMRLRPAPVVPHGVVVRLVEQQRLYGQGLGWIDMHLLAAAVVGARGLMTYDERLSSAASRLGVLVQT